MFSETILLSVLIILALTAFLNFLKKSRNLSPELAEPANKMIITYNAFVGILLIGMFLVGLADGSLVEYFRSDEANWDSIISIGGSTLAFVFISTTAKYKLSMESMYKNDERWQSIVANVNKKLYGYHVFLVGLTVIVMIVGTIVGGDENLYINFQFMIMAIFVILASRDLVELFLLRKYDRTM